MSRSSRRYVTGSMTCAKMTPPALAAVSAALDLLGKDGPALGPRLVSTLASMTAIHAGLELLRECDPGFRFSADNVERTVAMSYLRELHPNRHGSREPRICPRLAERRAP